MTGLRVLGVISLSLVAPAPLVEAQLLISELQASNKSTILDEDGEASDWIEILNPGPAAVDLLGWSLTDDPALLARWYFPARALPAGEYLLVFASGKDRAPPLGELHANFKLESAGEYLALVKSDGVTIAQQFAPAYPPQQGSASYGSGEEAIDPALVAEGATARLLVPTDASLGGTWTGGNEPFDDSAAAGWTSGPTGIGFDLGGDDEPPIFYYDFNDASDPEVVPDRSPLGHPGRITSHFEIANFGGSRRPTYAADGSGHTGLAGDRAIDFGTRGDGGTVAVDAALTGLFDDAAQHDAITISLWILGSVDQPANDVVFWGSSNADGTGTRSLNAHVPWGDQVVYWDTSGCCDSTERVQKGEPDGTKWRGRWNHWVFVKAGDIKRIYQNGELFLEGENTANLTPVRGFFIGCAPNSGEMAYGGLMDDFAVWDSALTPLQILALSRGISPLGLSSLIPLIKTDVSSHLYGRSSTAYVRIPFTAPAGSDANALLLSMRYDDGFVAYLNGVEVARRNAPPALSFNSAATVSRAPSDAVTPELIDLTAHLGLVHPGLNVLAFQALNSSETSGDYLLLPELRLVKRTPGRYLLPPTPGSANSRGFLGFVEDVRFSVEHGLFTEPFDVTLTCATGGAEIRYTLDGSPPATEGSASKLYTAPIRISRATTLRAAAFKSGFEPAPSVTRTYLFPATVAAQPSLPAGLPATWSGGTAADYQMDPDVVRSALPGYGLDEALRAIPSVSIAMDPKDLWTPGAGIYYSSEQVLERPASIELIHPDGSEGFQINAGIRIHGYTSRLHSFTPKHSFRITFKSQFGPSKLEHRLFDDDEVDRFDQIVLRGMSTDSWPVMDGWDGPEPGTKRWFREKSLYLREQWMKDSQLDMGQLAPHARYVHVYLNGLYWGVYHLTERPTDSFHAAHQGGEREEFDVLKDFAEVQSGNGNAWAAMMQLASGGLATQAAYERIQGNNPDGSRNPAYPRYVDVDNLIDYMILHIYASADDWPNHNWWGGRRRGDASEGFKFFAWDQEITHISLDYAHTSWGPRYEDAGAPDSPSFLYAQMKANPAFRLRFGDRVQKHLFGNGALTPEASAMRLERRAAEIDQAIVAESARWGDARRAVPFKREVEWLSEIERLTLDHWPRLHPIALERFRRVGLYPDVAAPVFSQDGGRIEPGFALRLSAPQGKVYYTLDGSDPRTPAGGIAPSALAASADAISLAGTTRVKARAQSAAKWSALAESFFHVDVPLRITELQYHPRGAGPEGSSPGEEFEFLEIQNVGEKPVDLHGARITGAVRFNFSDGVLLSLAPGKLLVVVRSYDAFVERYGAGGISIAGEYAGELSNLGERIVLEGPGGEPIHDFRYSDRWQSATDGEGPSLVIRDPHGDPSSWNLAASWRASARPLGSPGIDEDAPPPGGRRVGGDFNGDAALGLSDAIGLLGYLFIDASSGLPCEGELESQGNLSLLDSNGDEQVDLTDAVFVLGYLFLGGPRPILGTDCVSIAGCAEACKS